MVLASLYFFLEEVIAPVLVVAEAGLELGHEPGPELFMELQARRRIF